jgi:hypothetical protein
MTRETIKLILPVSEEVLRRALSEYEREPIRCERCECALKVGENKPRIGMVEAECGCCGFKCYLDVQR